MSTFIVVEFEVSGEIRFCFRNVAVRFQVHFLVFDRSPQSLREDVVHAAASTIHGDLHIVSGKHVDEFLVGELRALVGVGNLRSSEFFDRFVHRLYAEIRFHGRRQIPSDYQPAKPIDDGVEVTETVSHSDVGDITAPDVVREACADVTKEIWIYLVIRVFKACFLGFRVYGLQSHQPHHAPYSIAAGVNFVVVLEICLYSP